MATQITVRDVDEHVFREFKAEAVKQGMTLGSALTLAMGHFTSLLSGKRAKLTAYRPVAWGAGTARVSEQVDDILYE